MDPLLREPRQDDDCLPGSLFFGGNRFNRELKRRAAYAAFLDGKGFLDECPVCGHSLAGYNVFTHIQNVDEDELDALIMVSAFDRSSNQSEAEFLYELSRLRHGE